MVNQMTRTMLWRTSVQMPRLLLVKAAGAKLCECRNVCGAWIWGQIIINGIYGVLLKGRPIISTLACDA